MRQKQLEEYKSWFAEYVSGFYGDDEYVNANIKLKEEHTGKVCEEMRYLAGEVGLGANDARAAECVALFHDVGRFPQFVNYRTYNDARSESHSALALEVLRKEKWFEGLEAGEAEVIRKAIAYHGIKELPEGLDERTLLFCRLIRDADKLDIFRVVVDYYGRHAADPENFKLEVEFPNEPWYSKEVLEAAMRGEAIDYNSLRTWNDAKIMQMGWVHDMNFAASVRRVRERGYMEMIAGFLPDDDQIRRLRGKIAEYVDGRIGAEK